MERSARTMVGVVTLWGVSTDDPLSVQKLEVNMIDISFMRRHWLHINPSPEEPRPHTPHTLHHSLLFLSFSSYHPPD